LIDSFPKIVDIFPLLIMSCFKVDKHGSSTSSSEGQFVIDWIDLLSVCNGLGSITPKSGDTWTRDWIWSQGSSHLSQELIKLHW
jgi:hypothetical protein